MYLNREEAIVFVIDIQEKLFNVIYQKEELLKNCLKLLKGCQILNLPILATEQYPKGLGKTLPEIKNFLKEENIFEKLSFSAYIPAVIEKLEKINKRSIILIGIEAHVCIWQTCRDLLKNNFKVFIPQECVSSRSKIHLYNALELMDKIGAYIVNVETILFDLLKTAEVPEFKAISQIIK